MSEEEVNSVLDVHLRGAFYVSQPAFRAMKENNFGRFVFTASGAGIFGNFGQSNYGAAKTGIAGFSRVLALELAKYGATVNTISPGASTRMTIHLREARGLKTDLEDSTQSPAQIAPVVTWLASAAGQETTGQIIDVMQGWVGIMQQPAVVRSFSCDRFWTLEDLDQVMPALLDAKREHDERVKEQGAPTKLD